MRNLKISTRLIVMVATLSLLLMGIGLMGLLGIGKSNEELKTLHDEAMVPALMADESINQLVQNRMQVLLAFQHAPGNPLAAIHDHPVSAHLDAIAARRVESNRLLKDLQALAVTPEDKALFEMAEAKRMAWRDKLNKVLEAVGAGDFSPATMAFFLAAGRQEGEAAVKAMNAFRDHQVQEANEAYNVAQSRYHTAVLAFSVATLMGLLLAALLCYSTIRTLRRQLGGEPCEAAAIATHVGAGDLSVPISLRPGDSTSLMAQLKGMQEHLSQVVANVRDSSVSVASASSQIATGSQDLSERTERQAGALEETAATMEELNAAVNNNANGAQQANQLAQQASTVAIKGGEVVAQVVDTMKHINDSSKRVFEIISLIDSIAFQTNILALNAAVEAARAGDQGRGFAVVASEVRSLAGRTAEAAKSIKTLISTSVTTVEQGCALVDQAGSTMAEVVSSIGRVTAIMGEISMANTDQSLNVSQVGEAVSQIDQITQQNAAMVEEMAAAAASLGGQAQELSAAMVVFKLPGDQASPVTKPKTTMVTRARPVLLPNPPRGLAVAA